MGGKAWQAWVRPPVQRAVGFLPQVGAETAASESSMLAPGFQKSALNTSRKSVARGRPPGWPSGKIGSTIFHCSSVRSVEYGVLSIHPPYEKGLWEQLVCDRLLFDRKGPFAQKLFQKAR